MKLQQISVAFSAQFSPATELGIDPSILGPEAPSPTFQRAETSRYICIYRETSSTTADPYLMCYFIRMGALRIIALATTGTGHATSAKADPQLSWNCHNSSNRLLNFVR